MDMIRALVMSNQHPKPEVSYTGNKTSKKSTFRRMKPMNVRHSCLKSDTNIEVSAQADAIKLSLINYLAVSGTQDFNLKARKYHLK